MRYVFAEPLVFLVAPFEELRQKILHNLAVVRELTWFIPASPFALAPFRFILIHVEILG